MLLEVISLVFFRALLSNGLPTNQTTTTLSLSEISSFSPYTHYASTAYCPSNVTMPWSCGGNCLANSLFIPTASGGDGDAIQYWYVGYDPTLKTAIVAHQGTNKRKFSPYTIDVDAIQRDMDSTLFPGLEDGIKMHTGFAKEHSMTATTIFSLIQNTISQHNATAVTFIGHSLGGAIAVLDSLYFTLHSNSNITTKVVAYGLPRIGNQEFADYVDRNLSVIHVNNKNDPIPTLPPSTDAVGKYVQVSGEIHIEDTGEWMNCPGQENSSDLCTFGLHLIDSHFGDHTGPYNGIVMDCYDFTATGWAATISRWGHLGKVTIFVPNLLVILLMSIGYV